MSTRILLVAVLVSAAQLPARSQSDGVLKVEPEWGPELQRSYYVDVALVQVHVDSRGRPSSLNSETPLPENVVDALANWQFASASPAGYTVKISVRRALDAESVRALHRFWRPARFKDAMEAGRNSVSAPSLADLSRNIPIEDQEQDIAAQLAWYANHTRSLSPDAVRKRADLIAFLVENAPNSELLASPLTTVSRTGDLLGDTPPHDYIRSLWIDRAGHSLSSDSKIVLSIANFLELTDPEVVEPLLQNSSLNVATIWIGDLWARAALGVSAVDPLTGRASNISLDRSRFADHARSSLETTNDRRILASALWSLTNDGYGLAASGRLPDGYPSLCAGLLARWKTADPQSTFSCDPGKPPTDTLADAFMNGTLQLPHLVHKTEPKYSERARTEHINGAVKARLIVGVDGRPSRIELLSGPIPLVQPALDALWTWRFEPATADGRPVAYPAVVETNFKIR